MIQEIKTEEKQQMCATFQSAIRLYMQTHSNYALWLLMSHGNECQTLASLSLSLSQLGFYWASLCGPNFTAAASVTRICSHTHIFTHPYIHTCNHKQTYLCVLMHTVGGKAWKVNEKQ